MNEKTERLTNLRQCQQMILLTMLRCWNWAVSVGPTDAIGNKGRRSKKSPSLASLSHCVLIVCHFVVLNRCMVYSTNYSAFAFSFHNNLQPCFLSPIPWTDATTADTIGPRPTRFPFFSAVASLTPPCARSVRCPHNRENSCFIIRHLSRVPRTASQTWKLAGMAPIYKSYYLKSRINQANEQKVNLTSFKCIMIILFKTTHVRVYLFVQYLNMRMQAHTRSTL